jgi:hypothetical protein
MIQLGWRIANDAFVGVTVSNWTQVRTCAGIIGVLEAAAFSCGLVRTNDDLMRRNHISKLIYASAI